MGAGIGWTIQISNPGRGKRYFSSPQSQDWFQRLPRLLFGGHHWPFSRE